MGQLKPNQILNKAYRQVAIETEDFNHFKEALHILLSTISDGQREETQKEHLRNFLSDTFYKPYYMAPEEDIDLAVRLDKTSKSNIGLLIEVKSTTNKNEMISVGNLNRKAFQELLLYYLRERISKKNTDIKYLIATNVYEYFIFDAQEFEQKFYQNKKLKKEFQDFEDGRKTSRKTDFFYSEIASSFIEEVADSLNYTYFDIRSYAKYLGDDTASRKLIELYKVFSDVHLLKLPFQNDSNSLNKKFYAELLHILGIEEKKENNKIVIVRKAVGQRNEASLLENTINQLDAEDCLRKVPNVVAYGSTQEERLFNVAMELCITWINRILFLKLLEAQMLKYHNGEQCYKFLSIKKIRDFDDLNTLFFQVLARNVHQRTASILKDFEYVPYLNSSLFEVSELESNTIKINSLSQRTELPLFTNSVLINHKEKQQFSSLPTLNYLFAFLDAYNFASEGSEEVQEEAKTLINASVLGLIFEKINGHKDGSVFTPGFITMYMCREAVVNTVLTKFNNFYNWHCKSIADLYNQIDDIPQANQLINSITICDPAVGSGHFLVSALNELIRLKYELGILVDSEGKRIKKSDYTFCIENDELIVTDADNNLFSYNPLNEESRRIQETLFKEKKTIIENCLFGVDLNPNSVKICRLRLWIELLKNAYYTAESDYKELETLPNIDINIKCGNSLVHRFDLTDSIKSVLKETGISISQYRNAVSKYKNAQDKAEKWELDSMIAEIKSKLTTEIGAKDPKKLKLNKRKAELMNLLAPQLFEMSKKEQKDWQKRVDTVKKEIAELESYFEEINSNKIYLGAFEWRIEFPEVLDADGNFIGFDCVIGNPPYIQLQSMGTDADVLERMKYKTYVRTGDIYCLFYEQGMNLLKPNGCLCYITSNKWMRAGYGKELRQYFIAKTNPVLLIDFAGIKIFDAATVETNILIAKKESYTQNTLACIISNTDDLNKLSVLVQQQAVECNFAENDSWIILSAIEQSIKRKIEAVGTPLKDWDIRINYGIKTGFNEAFVITTDKRNEILANCQTEDERTRTAELIRPILRGRDIKRYAYNWAGLYLIATFPSRHYDIEMYPAVKQYLLTFGIEKLEQTGKTYIVNGEKIKARKKTNNKWFEIQDSISYWEDFSKPKIVWGNLNLTPNYALVENNSFINAPSSMIVPASKYLLAILNSKIADFYIKLLGVTRNGGYFEYKPMFIEQLPIPQLKIENKELAQIERLIDNNNYTEIEYIVYNLYGLTQDEINYINSL
ncbi:Eco57I restriction-modification methylase domain-containing protein [Bacteroides caecicola]|uniref:type IIG restriction enzyme/methyltransferase n=1 Tax=Bacteroides caecicola TaxID=1462569 RepID=UPI002011B01D|nr:Eco57I restriction-modification methylase domain-containing protein [Bacteroides caecicola]MCL1626685.1 Eco57I restriction-modification methylase domain-containing protein [Bacteroides caecicola]